MENLFNWICFGFMWLMIFGVILYYVGFVEQKNIQHTLLIGTGTILSGSLCWLAGGYSLSFFGDFKHSIFLQALSAEDVSTLLVQLLFCLYAVVMLIGSVLERGSWRYIVIFVPLWILLIYSPVCYFIWGEEAVLSQLGVLDFSGGLVVHATAGIGSLVLALNLPVRTKKTELSALQYAIAYLGMLFITLGWFGFNMSPAGAFGGEAIKIWLNTLLSIIGGGISWFSVHRLIEQKYSITAMMNGMITGLVGSTCSVGYVTPLVSFLIAIIVSSICPLVIAQIQKRYIHFDDAVDSFGMNGVGGVIGSILTGFFASNGQVFVQIGGTLLVCLWSFLICWVLNNILSRFISATESDEDLLQES